MSRTLRQSHKEYLALRAKHAEPASDAPPPAPEAPAPEPVPGQWPVRPEPVMRAEPAPQEPEELDEDGGFEIPPEHRDPTPQELIQRIRPKRPPPTRAEKLARIWAHHPAFELFRHKKRVAFYRQFHKLVRSGSSLNVGLKELARHAPSGPMRKAIERVARQIQRGDTLAQAMRDHSGEFDDVNVEIIALGEESGSLQQVLERIVEHMERMQKLRWQVVMSSLWPLYLMAAVTFVGPLMGLGGAVNEGTPVAALPGVYLSGLAMNLLALLAFIALVLGWPFLMTLLGTEVGWDRLKLKVPGAARAFRSIYASRFYLTLGLAVSSGIEIVKATGLALRASGSPFLASRVPAAEAQLRSGAQLTDVIVSLDVFESTDLGTISVGERTGTLDEAFDELAEDHREGAIRGMRFLSLALLGAMAVVFLGLAIKMLLGTLFGPIMDYFNTIDDLLNT